MNAFLRGIAVVSLALLPLCGCATTVTLVPDENGAVGRAVVKGKDGSAMVLKTPRESVAVRLGHARPVRDAGDAPFRASLSALPEAAVSVTLHFDSDSTTLSPNALAALEKAIAVYKTRENARVMVIGHTDSAGDAAFNERLARQRADAAAAHLREAGMEAAALRVEGFGAKQPLVPEDAAGHAPENRRVEVFIW